MLSLRKSSLVLLVSLLAAWPSSSAQSSHSSGGDDDPRLEQLYNEAKQSQSQGDINTAIAKYQEMLRIAPKLTVAYNNLGALYFRQQNYSKAAGVLEEGLKINPALPTAKALLGICWFELGDYTRALPALEAATKANPNDENALTFLAKDMMKLGKLDGSLAILQKVAARQTKNQEVFYLLATVYMRLSEDALAKMNAIDPNSVLAHQLSAEVMESMNNYDGAVVQLKKAIEMAPRQPGTHYQLGNAYWNLSQWDQAAAEFNAELALSPGNCRALWKLGNIVLQKGGSAEDALASLNQAVAACPELADAREDRARALVKLNRNSEAIEDLEAAEKAEPNDASVHFLLSKVYRAAGRQADAAREMELFSKLDEAARAATAARAEEVIKDKQTAH